MGYWMHVYSCDDEPMTFDAIVDYFADEDDVTVELCAGERGAWKQISLDRDGDTFALVELFTGDEVPGRVNDEIAKVLETRPRCNAEYVARLMLGVKAIYQFQIIGEVDDAVRDLQETLTYGSEAVLWAEGEGFSCDRGHLTWEFSDGVSGGWNVTLHDAGKWSWFRIDLGDAAHREAFLEGRRPEGV